MTRKYTPMNSAGELNRREFLAGLAGCSVAAGALVLGRPARAGEQAGRPPAVGTNIDSFMKVKKGPHAIPGAFPGKVVEVYDPKSLADDKPDAKVIAAMFERGITGLTGDDLGKSFAMFFTRKDVVGIKVNPVGAPLISTRLEVVDAVIGWLAGCGLPRQNIVIWDRFDGMLAEAGYTPERFPGVRIEALQTMAENGDAWRGADGKHVSQPNFDRLVYYEAKGVSGKKVAGYKSDEAYENQHVFTGERSYFGKLVTRKLTKIINIPVFKNTGHSISMATKNLGYGAICNTGRLHRPLFLRVCTEVTAAPCIRDKLVLNINDGLRGQYDGGPMKNAQFVYPHHRLYFATDPFALDMLCHRQLAEKRKAAGVKVDTHPRYTEYLRQAERLGLGIADPARIRHVVLGS